MDVLVDTHTFLWYAWDDSQLSSRVNHVLDNGDNNAYISIVSLWEIAIKNSIGKLDLKIPLDDFFMANIDDNGFEILPLTRKHTSVVQALPFHHRDPFDRILVAQSIVEAMPLLSGDTKLDAYSINRYW